jgi:hypothetical protein
MAEFPRVEGRGMTNGQSFNLGYPVSYQRGLLDFRTALSVLIETHQSATT